MVFRFFIPRLQYAFKNFGQNLHGRQTRALTGIAFGSIIFLLLALHIGAGIYFGLRWMR